MCGISSAYLPKIYNFSPQKRIKIKKYVYNSLKINNLRIKNKKMCFWACLIGFFYTIFAISFN